MNNDSVCSEEASLCLKSSTLFIAWFYVANNVTQRPSAFLRIYQIPVQGDLHCKTVSIV